MKKICFVTTIASTMDSFVLELSKFLHSTGEFDIAFICSEDETYSKNLPEFIHYFPITMKRGISLGGIKACNEIKKIFKREKFDIVQYSTPNASCYAFIAAKQANVPVRLYCQWGIVYVGFKGIKRVVFKEIEKMVCRNSTWIEPDSFGNLQFSIDEGLYSQNKSSVVWNGSASGVSLIKFDIKKKFAWRRQIREKLQIDSNAFVFGFVGRITKDKGINELFAAYKQIYDSNSSVYLILVGNPEKADGVDDELYYWIKNNKNVFFVGYTNVVEQYLSAMDCFVLPSYREGFGLGVIEAEAMGLPVIVSNIPGPTDAMLNNETGIIVDKKNTEQLKDAMLCLYNDGNKRKVFGENGYKFATERFEQNKLFELIYKDRLRLLNGCSGGK